MPSDLQRVARGLVQCLDEVPQVVLYLQRTADRCRENAALAISASRGQATVAAHQLDAAARACEQAAHYLSMAPPKARAWAEGLVGDGRSTERPGTSSADRNKATGGAGDAERDERGRAKRLVVRLPRMPERDDDEDDAAEQSTERLTKLAEGKEPPLVEVARKAFEKYRKRREQDEERREEPEPLEVELVVAETGEVAVLAREKDERELAELLERDDEEDRPIEVELAATELLKAMEHRWKQARLVITEDRATATFEYDEQPPARRRVVDVELPEPDEITPPRVEPELPEPGEIAPREPGLGLPERDDLAGNGSA